jgi:Condensation domain/Phosphopantetheine attachment site/TubC N-terminal docking domain
MKAPDLLQQLRHLNLEVTVVDDNLKISGRKEALTADLLQEIRQHKAGLLACLTSERIRSGAIPRTAPQDRYAVSSAQKRIWLTHQINGSGQAYHMPFVCRIRGSLNGSAFGQAWQDLAQRHESLRTVFRAQGGIPYQVIQAEPGAAYAEEDLRHLASPETHIDSVLPTFIDAEFSLEDGPLWRVKTWQVADQDYVVALVMHHIIGDGWSMGVLMRDLFGRYVARLEATPAPSDPLPIQYRDFVAWETTLRETTDWAEARSYWLDQMAGEISPVDLRPDFSRPASRTREGAVIRRVLTPPDIVPLRALARQQEVSLYVLLLTTFNAVLHQHTDTDDIIIGCPAAGRTHWQLDDQIGLYVNTLPIRNRIHRQDSFADLLQRVKQSVVQGYGQQAYGLDDLIDDLKLPRRPGRGSLFDVAFTMQNEDFIEQVNGYLPHETGLSVLPCPVAYQPCKFDWLMDVQEASDTLTIDFTYDPNLFQVVRMERLMAHFCQLLEQACQQPDRPVSRLPVFTNAVPPGLIRMPARPVTRPANPSADCLPPGSITGTRRDFEKQLVAIWQKILLRPAIDPTDDFFQIGGNSLKMVVLFSELQKTFPRNGLILADLFKFNTVQSLTDHLFPVTQTPEVAAIDV